MRVLNAMARLAMVLVAGVGAVAVAAPTPAHADAAECSVISGAGTAYEYISLCLEDYWTHPAGSLPTFRLYSHVTFGILATSATGCKVTLYAELDKAGSDIWKSAKVTRDCTSSLISAGNTSVYLHGVSGTSATVINVHGCIDLYYNNSTSSGWQRCATSGWHATS
jgi:hypothetical protein